MIDIETLKSLFIRSGIYLLDNMMQVRKVISDKFPGLSELELDSECKKIAQNCYVKKGDGIYGN